MQDRHRPEDTTFLPEIEVLRGVSIILVLFYHLQAPFFVSGYLGVDMFFIISGYLMALLYAELPDRRAVFRYYRKRFDRVMPAYFVALVATVGVSASLILPHELADVLRHATWSAAMMPNIGFWMDNTYFDKGVFKPFLHFWSLGVEVQFYLVFPLIIYLYRRSPAAVFLLMLASLAACFVVTGLSPKTSFFMMPLRLWEFLAGFFACTFARSIPALPAARLIGLAGLCLTVTLACISWDVASHPKYMALAVCAATVAVIVFGLPDFVRAGPAGAVLQIVGKYSYSLYLTHFPVIVLYHYEPFAGLILGPNPPLVFAGLLALSAALAFANYHLVETPFRHGRLGRYSIALYGGLAVCLIAAGPLVVTVQRSGFTAPQLLILDAWADRGTYRCGKLKRVLEPFGTSCRIAGDNPARERNFLLVGNSHADAIKDAMGAAAQHHNAALHLMKQNCSLGSDDCRPEAVLDEVRRLNIGTVIVHSSASDVSVKAVAALIVLGEQNGFSTIYIDPVPGVKFNPPKELYRHGVAAIWQHEEAKTASEYLVENGALLQEMARLESPRYTRFPVLEYFCNPECRIVSDDGRPLYFDTHHLTITGAHWLDPVFDRIFKP
ncbi:MAG: acyltransferase family protein [Proteobacteria bacterium]|nr:acyltransferase family protein [Pseudomonadota bacterium]